MNFKTIQTQLIQSTLNDAGFVTEVIGNDVKVSLLNQSVYPVTVQMSMDDDLAELVNVRFDNGSCFVSAK